jgi:hypothetical protein
MARALALAYDRSYERQGPILLGPSGLSPLCAYRGHQCCNAPGVGRGSLGRGGGNMADRSIGSILAQ